MIQLGKPIKRDYAISCIDKLQYARVMVDVPLSRKLLEMISFKNENGELTRFSLHYEWGPTVCGKCTIIGHGVLSVDKARISGSGLGST